VDGATFRSGQHQAAMAAYVLGIVLDDLTAVYDGVDLRPRAVP
jgi:hypothetical protein